MGCIVNVYNNENKPSLLFKKLLEITKDEELALEKFAYFSSPAFLELFGDYQSPLETIISDQTFLGRLDENGEPKLHFNKALGRNYFLDKYNEPIYYPYDTGLKLYLDATEIDSISKMLALTYYTDVLNYDADTLEFDKKEDVTLEKFIGAFLRAKSAQLQTSTDEMKSTRGLRVEYSLDFIKEWEQRVHNFYKSLGVTIQKGEIVDTIAEQERSTRGEVARTESFLKSSKNNVNTNVKLFLSLMTTDTLNDYAELDFVPFDDIYSTLNKKLANKITTHDSTGTSADMFYLMLDEIEEVAKVKPYLTKLAKELRDPSRSELFQNQFVAAFNLYSKNYLGSEMSYINGEVFYTVKNLSEVNSRKSGILSLWSYNARLRDLGIAEYTQIKNDLLNRFANFDAANMNEAALENYSNIMQDILGRMGIVIKEKEFNYYLTSQTTNDLEGKIDALDALRQSIEYGVDNYVAAKGELNIFVDQGAFKKLADAVGFFISEGSDASVWTMGKTKWMYSLPSYLEKTIISWQQDPNILQAHYESGAFQQGSEYAKYLLALRTEDTYQSEEERIEESKKRLNEIEIGVFNSVQTRGNSTSAVDNKTINSVDALVDYVNKLIGVNKVWHKTALAAGKATEYQINWGANNVFHMEAGLTGEAGLVFENGMLDINDSIVELFFKYFQSDYRRMVEVWEEAKDDEDTKAYNKEHGLPFQSKLTMHYHFGRKNGMMSQLFPSLSISFDENGNAILPKIDTILYREDGSPMLTTLSDVKSDLKKHIKKALLDKINATNNLLIDSGLFVYDINGVLTNKGVDSSSFAHYLQQAGSTNNIPNIELAVLKLAGDIFVNSTISQVEYSKLITGDVAFYKDFADYKKRGNAPYTDGTYMRIKEGEEMFNAAIITAVDVATPNLDKLKEMLSDDVYQRYTKVNATDAQAWITPARWKFIMDRIGKSTKLVESIYKKFHKVNPVYTREELKLLAQPLKGVYFAVLEGKPTFLKYSQAVLLPGLIRNSPLQKIYDSMVLNEKGGKLDYQDQIHETITEDGIKVGLPQPVTTHTANGNIKDKFKLEPIQLLNSAWKLQQDLPTKGIKSTKLGSQIQVNIFQGLAFSDKLEFQVGDKLMSNQELMSHIHNLFGTMTQMATLDMYNKLGINPTSGAIENEDTLYSTIVRQLEENRNAVDNYVDGFKSKTSPYGIPGAFNLFQNVFSSLVNKATVEIRTNGGGFIQMADYGLSKSEASEKGTLFTPWFNENKLSPPVIGINPKTGKEILKPGGIFLSGSFIAKYIPDYKALYNENPALLFGKLNEETGEYEGGKLDSRILQKIIGYRIPNQALSSNDALTVMGILTEETGDTVVAYTGITEKTGSDFDIDKMYLMLPAFKVLYEDNIKSKINTFIEDRQLDEEDISLALEEFHPGISEYKASTQRTILINEILDNEALSLHDEFFNNAGDITALKLVYEEENTSVGMFEQSSGALQNMLIEAYTAVLTHPKLADDIMTPIEVPVLKDDLKSLSKGNVYSDLVGFSALNDLIIKNEFRQGKAALGQAINQSMDSVLGSMANLSLKSTYLGWGTVDGIGNTAFDGETSETLSKVELRQYVISYNNNLPEGAKKIELKDLSKYASIPLKVSMTGYINGFVDVEKDAYIIQNNWNTNTSDLGFMLIRAGVHPFKVNAFLAQPMLKSFIAFKANNKSNLVDNTKNAVFRFKLSLVEKEATTEEDTTINGVTLTARSIIASAFTGPALTSLIIGSYKTKGKAEDSFFINMGLNIGRKFNILNKDITPEQVTQLEDVVKATRKLYDKVFNVEKLPFHKITLDKLRGEIFDEQTLPFQLSILDRYNSWDIYVKSLVLNMAASKSLVDGKGKNITSTIIQYNKIQAASNSLVVLGFNSKLHTRDALTSLAHTIENSVFSVLKVMEANPKFFLSASTSAINTFNAISTFINGGNLQDEKLADAIEKAHTTYILSGFPALQTTISEREDLIDNLHEDIAALKHSGIDNLLINELKLKESEDGTKTFIGLPNLKFSNSFKNRLVSAWDELLLSHPKEANALVKYSFLVSGFNNTLSQFHEFIPYSWMNKNQINGYLKSLNIESNDVDRIFIRQFFKHNYKKYNKKVYGSSMNVLSDGTTNSGFILAKAQIDPPYITVFEDVQPEATYETYFELTGILKSGHAIYTVLAPSGFKDFKNNNYVEYNSNHIDFIDGVVSINPGNKLPSYADSALIRDYRVKFGDFIHYRTNFAEPVLEKYRLERYNTDASMNFEEEEEATLIDENGNEIVPGEPTATHKPVKEQGNYFKPEVVSKQVEKTTEEKENTEEGGQLDMFLDNDTPIDFKCL